MQHEDKFLDRAEVARRWFAEESRRSCGCCARPTCSAPCTDAEAYMAVASERYRLIRTHEWTDEVIEGTEAATPASPPAGPVAGRVSAARCAYRGPLR